MFPDAVIAEADRAEPVGMAGREDLRDLPLGHHRPGGCPRPGRCGSGGRPIPTPATGGFVSLGRHRRCGALRPPGSRALDREARRRGNSTYFPDRVVPMLPDILSGDLCSAARRRGPALSGGADGDRRAGPQAQPPLPPRDDAVGRLAALCAGAGGGRRRAGRPTAPLLEPVLKPLYAAYAALKLAREVRQPLDLDLPERKIELDDEGRSTSVAFKERLDAHKLIEEFMILANVAAAEELIRLKRPCCSACMRNPVAEKLEALREVAEAAGLTLAKGQVLKTAHLNRLLAQAEGTEFDELINITTLRSMTQAYYHPENFGHFGLALRNYAHFTSPIRRYSDLIVHRALIRAMAGARMGCRPGTRRTWRRPAS
jgi:ribonuclease R